MADNFIKTLDKLASVTARLPARAGTVAVNFSKERFVQKNWVDHTRQPWKKRKREGRGSTLVQSGRLKRSIRKITATRNWILIGTDVPYARIHNEGGVIKQTVQVKAHKRRTSRAARTKTGRRSKNKRETTGITTVKAHTRRMQFEIQQRQFLGDSAVLGRRIERLIEKDIKKALS